MVLDPLSALSLAGNLIQFLDFSVQLIDKGHKLYHSNEGALDKNIELQVITSNLIGLNQKLENSAEHTIKATANGISSNEKALLQIISGCNKVGKELVDALE